PGWYELLNSCTRANPAKRIESIEVLISRLKAIKPREEEQYGKLFQFEIVTVNSKGKITNREEKPARYQTEDLGKGVTLDMVYIPGGKFTMGSTERDYEKPPHPVTVQPFFMAKYPVTQSQWQAVMGNNPSSFKGENRPVENISWDDVVKFCQQLSEKTGKEYRLPSEAEWEYACRAGTTTPFYFGETITTDLANYGGNSTTDVGSFPPNAFGLYDMHGNVWEWCADAWHDNYKGAPSDGSIWGKKGLLAKWFSSESRLPVVRGGSWLIDARSVRTALRNWYSRDFRGSYVGFRLARITL
ncbi:MAG: hypothetical protein DRQ57_07740, partial [Gammaproteobacteria bacterium]